MTTLESETAQSAVIDRLPLALRAGLALGVAAIGNAIHVAPASAHEMHETYANTPVGVVSHVSELISEGNIVAACNPKLTEPGCMGWDDHNIKRNNAFKPLRVFEVPSWLSVESAHPSEVAAQNLENTRMIEVDTPMFKKIGGLCFFSRKTGNNWRVAGFVAGKPNTHCVIPDWAKKP